MTESAYSSIRGAEISERSSELVLPGGPASSARGEPTDDGEPPAESGPGSSAWRTSPLAAATGLPGSAGAVGDSPPHADAAIATSQLDPAPAAGGTGPAQLGRALPGDRGPRDLEGGAPRPSFWRRIALGRRGQALRASQPEHSSPTAPAYSVEPPRTATAGFDSADPAASEGWATPARRIEPSIVPADAALVAARSSEVVERRIVEPLLQALVSVEAKLERSHVDLIGRSDQVEQRLTQLWDIEEQLGTLGELQESLLQVTEQQRRLETALVAQTRILRWLVGGIILSLAAAAFSVAFFLRVTR